MERLVTSKTELKKAVKDNAEVIIVDEKTKNEIKSIVKIMKMSESKINKTIGFLSVSGAAIVTSITATPITGGTSGMAAMISGLPAVAAFAKASSIPIKELVAIILICVTVGVACVIELLRCYELKDNDNEFEINIKEGHIKFIRRKKYREHNK